MSMNSINTNMGAMVALESLNKTNAALNTTQNSISTGYRVSNASDDGAAFAVAQRIRSDVGALTTANQQLGSTQGLLQTTTGALTNVQTSMNSVRSLMVNLSNTTVTGDQRSQYMTQLKTDMTQIKSFISDANYNGKSLIGNFSGSSSGFGSATTVRNEVGGTYTISAQTGATAVYNSILAMTSYSTATAFQSALTATSGSVTNGKTGLFAVMFSKVSTMLNGFGASQNYVGNQMTYNSDKIDALNSGLGSLVDADMTQESANLTALQTRQQLAVQSLSIANQAPQTLLSLFK